MPLINGICKRLLIRIAQNMHNLSQLFARFKFRSPREVARNNSFLMKVTHLHRQLGEKFSYPWSAIYYYGLKRKALPLKCISCALVLVDCLALNFAPIHIAAVVSITHNKITTWASKKHTVYYRNNFIGDYDRFGKFVCAQFLAYPMNGATIMFSKLRDNGSILQKSFPERRTTTRGFADITKTSSAGMTKIALNASNNSNFFCFPRPTWAAFFSTLFTSLNNYAINYMILNNNLLFLDTVFCNYASFSSLRIASSKIYTKLDHCLI